MSPEPQDPFLPREMVYLEFKAAEGDNWENRIGVVGSKAAENRRERDHNLAYLETPHTGPLAYLLFANLWDLIIRDENWHLFQPYFPPKDILQAKLNEFLPRVRNRIAHFRTPHEEDVARVRLFLRDIDQGIHKFFTSYNAVVFDHQLDKDEVAVALRDDHIIRHRADSWPTAVGKSSRPWAGPLLGPDSVGPGILYDVRFMSIDREGLDYGGFLLSTEPLHRHVAYINYSGWETPADPIRREPTRRIERARSFRTVSHSAWIPQG